MDPKKIALAVVLTTVFSVWMFTIPVAATYYNLEVSPGLTVVLGTTVTATATTDNTAVDNVVFRWEYPEGTFQRQVTDANAPFEDSYTPDEVGEWLIIATFRDGTVKQARIEVVITVIPDMPLGVIVGLIAPFAALGMKTVKTKHRR